jgi:hypothetical protein
MAIDAPSISTLPGAGAEHECPATIAADLPKAAAALNVNEPWNGHSRQNTQNHDDHNQLDQGKTLLATGAR